MSFVSFSTKIKNQNGQEIKVTDLAIYMPTAGRAFVRLEKLVDPPERDARGKPKTEGKIYPLHSASLTPYGSEIIVDDTPIQRGSDDRMSETRIFEIMKGE